jgi:two-component system sensor histidine kinase GlrK
MYRMRWAFPKSLNGFLLLGLGVIAVPLLAAILRATIQMGRLTTFSQQLVLGSVQTTRLSQNMFEEIASLERAARLYELLGNGTVLATLRDQDARLSNTIEELRTQVSSPQAGDELTALVSMQRNIRAAVRPSLAGTPAGIQSPDFGPLGAQAARIAQLIDQQIDTELASLQTQTDSARQELFWESTLLVPLVLLATLAFTLGLGRPLRQIDRAIGELGRGNFAHKIVVAGPADLERLGHQLEWLRSRLLDLAQERNRFLRHVSHELKTPLANIREGTELLTDGTVGELDTSQREVTAILQENSIKLQRMIENLLSYSAWQSNSVGLDPSEFRLRPLVKQVLENQQLTLVSQRARLEVRIEDLTLYADRGKIRLILENLLSNAIKYSPRGGALHLRAHSTDDEVILEVADSGGGIPMEQRAHIFDAFYTGRAPSGHIKGTGIGLSVVHEFVNIHRGTIELVDGEFPGAHFRIRMPLRAAPPAPLTVTNADRRQASPDRRNAHAA